MPPSGSPVKELIINDLVGTALPLVTAGAEYYTTVEQVTLVGAGPLELKMFPAIVVMPMETEYNRAGSQGTTTAAATFRVQLALFIRSRTDAVSKIERFIRDVHKALLVDRYRNGNAIHTRVVHDEVTYPTDDDEPFTTAIVTVDVDYRTRITDLNTPT